ncbi:uncharacterized protein [Halyomorpha halys]|uniref:uncharacterized protein isoform X2 n=1 Tax=Halyomorpha halys TaxID=286706 RepID=UPI0006D51306
MAKPQTAPKMAMVPPKGYWQTEWQKYTAYRDIWKKIEKEEIDLEEFRKRELVTYFDREPDLMYRNDYDRLFHPEDDFDPKIKIKAIRNNIIEEINNSCICNYCWLTLDEDRPINK